MQENDKLQTISKKGEKLTLRFRLFFKLVIAVKICCIILGFFLQLVVQFLEIESAITVINIKIIFHAHYFQTKKRFLLCLDLDLRSFH